MHFMDGTAPNQLKMKLKIWLMDTPETVSLSLSYFSANFKFFNAGLNLLCGGKYPNTTTFD